MRTYMIYLLLTGKRLLRQLPCFLAGLAVMVLLVGMAVAFGVSILAIRFLMGYIRKHDFEHVENPFTLEEAMQEAGRCLRCDHFGCGVLEGGCD